MKTIRSAALIGLGALGILFGRPISQTLPEDSFTVIADADRTARYRSGPITCTGEPCRFAFAAPDEGTPVDLILVAVKATTLPQAVRDIARYVGPDTVILSVLNGITSEDVLEAAYPGRTLWSVAIGMDATRTERTLRYKNPGMIQFGERSGTMTDRVAAVEEFLTRCGIANQACSDILYKQWYKLMINVGLNQTAAAYRLTYGKLNTSEEAKTVMLQAMHETIAAAHAEGIPLPDNAAERWDEKNLPTFNSDGMPSMLQDVLAGRLTEVEEFAGIVRRISAKHGLPTPANDFYYDRIRRIEAEY